MIFSKNYLPQFRESDADGLVGIKGYLYYFQDVSTHYMHNFHLGNDTMPEEKGVSWVYSKYKMHAYKKSDYKSELTFKTWVEKEKPGIKLWQDMEIWAGDELRAIGRVEQCVVDLSRGRLCKVSDIDFPFEEMEDRYVDLKPFRRFPRNEEGLEYCYTHKVQYTDLDKSHHMNNLKYIDLILNAFDSGFYENNYVSDMEIHYSNQSFEGEEIKVYKRIEGNLITLVGVKEDETIAVNATIEIGE